MAVPPSSSTRSRQALSKRRRRQCQMTRRGSPRNARCLLRVVLARCDNLPSEARLQSLDLWQLATHVLTLTETLTIKCA
jgi:hypothetical protein